MPMIAFFPWATAGEALSEGEFTIAPFCDAAALMPDDHVSAVREVIATYHKSDDDMIARVPVLFRTAATPTDDLQEESVGSLYQQSEMIAFAALASRQFFMPTYWNRDSFRLVVQRFRPERPGGALITYRRRDGHANVYVPAAHHRVRRPIHVPQAPIERLDRPLLSALQEARDSDDFNQLIDGVRGYNAANTDSPDIGQETELVMLIGAYSRVFGEWDEKGIAGALQSTFAVAPAWPSKEIGPKPDSPKLRSNLAKSGSIKREWVTDAFVLRGQFAHGAIQSPYRSIWGLRDHLLLGSYLFPLTVKAWLAKKGRYTLSSKDLMHIAAFDALASFDHFTPSAPHDDDSRRPAEYPWLKVVRSIPLQMFIADLGRTGRAPEF